MQKKEHYHKLEKRAIKQGSYQLHTVNKKEQLLLLVNSKIANPTWMEGRFLSGKGGGLVYLLTWKRC